MERWTQYLFDEIESLNQKIEKLKQEKVKLEARREHFQNYVEQLVNQAENDLAGGE
jgi:prefoldin subunit 5